MPVAATEPKIFPVNVLPVPREGPRLLPRRMPREIPPAIRTGNLGRTYKLPGRKCPRDAGPTPAHLVAQEGVNLVVQAGELFGLLGTNGAAKTTLIKILTTLLAPTHGSAQVDGFDVVSEPEKIRSRINMVSGGETSGYGILNVWENLWLLASFTASLAGKLVGALITCSMQLASPMLAY